MILTNNSPSIGYIAWQTVKISYKGTTYTIANGNTNLMYVYWKLSDPLAFYGSNSFPVLGPDDLLVFLNKLGTAVKVPNSTIIDGSLIVPESILAGSIAANAITGEKIIAGAISASSLAVGAVGADAIAARAVSADKMAVGTISAGSGIIGTAAITTAMIANLAVGNAAIANGAITNAKINDLDATKITAGLINAARVQIGAGSTFAAGFDPTTKATPADVEAAKSTNHGYRYYKKITIYGDSTSLYYPVVIKGGDQNVKRDILIKRGYSEQAPPDWNTATHKGGLTVKLKANFGGWGGANYSWEVHELEEMYSKTFAGAATVGSYMMFAIFLRGGGTTGAVYHIYSDQNIEAEVYNNTPTGKLDSPQIAYSTSELIGYASETYQWYAPAPRSYTQAVIDEIAIRNFIKVGQALDTQVSLWQYADTTLFDGGKIYTNTITANQIAVGTLTAAEIAAGTITGAKIATNTITATQIAGNTITAVEIAGNTITATQIKSLTITSAEIAAATITGAKIAANTITATQIAATTITAAEIAAATITGAKIAANTITATQIAAKTITAAEIVTGTITAASGIIGTAAITSANIANLAVGNAAIADGAITNAKITNLDATKITTGIINADRVQIGSGTTFADGYNPRVASAGASTKIFNNLVGINGGSGASSTVIIRTPITYGNYMTRIDLTGYVYTGGSETIDVSIGFYITSSGAFANTGYSSQGKTEVESVSLATDAANKVVIIVKFKGTTMAYPKLHVEKAHLSHVTAPDSFAEGWTIEFSTLLTGLTVKNTPPGQNYNASHGLTMLWQYADTTYINGGDIYTNTITANQIAVGTITANEIAGSTITGAKIAANTITALQIAATTITAAQIVSGTITATQIATDTITASNIAANAITVSELATNSVTAIKIVAGTITANEIAAGTITAAKIATDTITAGQIAANAITSSEINANAIIAGKIAADAVTAATIATGAVTADAILAGSITSTMINTIGLDAAVIKFGTMSGDRILANTIDANRLKAGTVIADNITFTGTLSGVSGTFTGKVDVTGVSPYGGTNDITIENGAVIGTHITNITKTTISVSDGTIDTKAITTALVPQPYTRSSVGSDGTKLWAGSNDVAETFVMYGVSNTNHQIKAAITSDLGIALRGIAGTTIESSAKALGFEYNAGEYAYMEWREGGARQGYMGWGSAGTSTFSLNLDKPDGSVSIRGDSGMNLVIDALSDGHTRLRGSNGPIIKFLKTLSQVQFRNYGDTAYASIVSSGHTTVSQRELKKNISPYDGDALHEIMTTPIREYHYNEDFDWEQKRLGIIVDESPLSVLDLTGSGISEYAMTTMSWKAIQQLNNRILELEAK